MRNKISKNMCDVSRDLQTPPLLQTATFSQIPLFPGAWSKPYFMHSRKTFITRHSVIQRRFDLIISRMRAIVQSKSFAYVGSTDWTLPAPGTIIPVCHLSSRGDDLRLSPIANPSTDAVTKHC